MGFGYQCEEEVDAGGNNSGVAQRSHLLWQREGEADDEHPWDEVVVQLLDLGDTGWEEAEVDHHAEREFSC